MSELSFDTSDIEKNKIVSSFAYLWILFLLPLFFGHKSKFAEANAKQGFILFIFQAITSIFVWVPIIGPMINLITFFIVPIIAITRTLTGKYWPIPVIHKYAEQINFD